MWQPPTTTTNIRNEGPAWILRVEPADGLAQEFTCASEEMARKLEAVFARDERMKRRRAS